LIVRGIDGLNLALYLFRFHGGVVATGEHNCRIASKKHTPRLSISQLPRTLSRTASEDTVSFAEQCSDNPEDIDVASVSSNMSDSARPRPFLSATRRYIALVEAWSRPKPVCEALYRDQSIKHIFWISMIWPSSTAACRVYLANGLVIVSTATNLVEESHWQRIEVRMRPWNSWRRTVRVAPRLEQSGMHHVVFSVLGAATRNGEHGVNFSWAGLDFFDCSPSRGSNHRWSEECEPPLL